MSGSKKYSNGEITVKWEPGLCIHSANCVKGLPGVFNNSKRPWINMQGASSEDIIRQVHQCPSGALSMTGTSEIKKDINMNENTVVADNKPKLVALEENKTYAWCACGRSKNQPWCDGSHKTTTIKPVVFRADAPEKKAMCMCKQTAGQPFCDGSHNSL